MSQVHQLSYPDELKDPKCLRCDVAMRLAWIEDEYPGYQRREFERFVCGGTMTEWAGRRMN